MRELEFKVRDNSYSIKMPNPLQMKQIMINKSAYSTGMYQALMNDGTTGAEFALDIIDIESYLTVLCPDLIEDIRKAGTTIQEMDLIDFNELRLAFKEQFVPWVNEWMRLLNAAPEEMPELKEPELKKNKPSENPERISMDNSGENVIEEEQIDLG